MHATPRATFTLNPAILMPARSDSKESSWIPFLMRSCRINTETASNWICLFNHLPLFVCNATVCYNISYKIIIYLFSSGPRCSMSKSMFYPIDPHQLSFCSDQLCRCDEVKGTQGINSWEGRWGSLMTILRLVSVFLNHIQPRMEGVSLHWSWEESHNIEGPLVHGIEELSMYNMQRWDKSISP